MILGQGLSEDALAHAEQVAAVAGVLHEAFEPEGFSATLVGGAAIEIHAPGIYLSGDLDYAFEALRKLALSDQPVTEAVLRNLLEKLGRRGPEG